MAPAVEFFSLNLVRLCQTNFEQNKHKLVSPSELMVTDLGEFGRSKPIDTVDELYGYGYGQSRLHKLGFLNESSPRRCTDVLNQTSLSDTLLCLSHTACLRGWRISERPSSCLIELQLTDSLVSPGL